MKVRQGAIISVCLALLFPAVFAAVFPAAAAAQTVTILLTSVTTVAIQHDTPPKGKGNKGDSIEFKDLLRNRAVAQFGKKKGKPVGYDAGIVRYTTDTKQLIEVKATFPGIGTITFEGYLIARKNGDIVLPITGGTGGFKGAKGTVTIGPGDATAPNTYRVTVPGTTLNIHGLGTVA